MAVEHLYNETVSVKRLTADSGNKKVYGSHIASLSCLIQPLDEDMTGDIPGGYGKDSMLFCGLADIGEADRIFRSDGTEYRVVGVERYDYGIEDHLEVRIRVFKS